MFSIWQARTAARAAARAAVGLGLATLPAFGAVTVTNAGTRAGAGSGVVIYYTLNEPATSVQIALSNGTNLVGGTARGVNEVTYNGSASGVSATITATAAAENGAGGAKVIVPVTAGDPGNITGIAFFNREGSSYRGEFLVASGFTLAAKAVRRYAGDGTLLASGDLKAISAAGSWPFGLAVGQQDPQDRVWIQNRSDRNISVLAPGDLSPLAKLATTYTYLGTSVTPVSDGLGGILPNQFNAYVGGNNAADNFGATYHYIADLSASPGTITATEPLGIANTGDAASTSESIAVDPTNKVLFKAHRSALGAAGALSVSLSKWTSPDGGFTWEQDTAWGTQVTTSIGVADAIPTGVALDKGFQPGNLNASFVWVAVSGGAANTNKLFKVNAATGAIVPEATIDLTQIAIPEGGVSAGDKPLRFIGVDYNGNIGITLGAGSGSFGGVVASHYAVLAPNTAGPTTASITLASVEPPLSGIASTDNPRVGNTGNATVDYSVDVFSAKGIVADNVQVTADLSAIGGGAAVALTRGTVSADGKSATYTASYKVPASAGLGTFNLPFTISAGSGTVVQRVPQTVYQAYVPSWSADVSGAVTGTWANGTTTYVATDAGNVYAFNADGTAAANFGGGGPVNVGEPVTNRIVAANGRLYVPGTGHLFILDLGTGRQVGSAAVPNPSAAAPYPADSTTVFVGASDNKVHALNAETGAQKYVSADLGAAVNTPSVGTAFAVASGYLLVAGTEAAGGSGKIVMLDPADLTQAYAPLTDAKGAVRSKAAFGLRTDGFTNYFVIGGASGLWAVSAADGTPFPWVTDSTHNGNPYATAAPVDADPAITPNNLRIMFADTAGNFYAIVADDGGKLSFGGVPAGVTTPPGTGGFADGAGILLNVGPAAADNSTAMRVAYLGSDQNDRRFFALNVLPDDSTFTLTPQNLRTFDPNDTATFPGETPGAFSDTPSQAGATIVVGSSAGRAYGFPTLVAPAPYVKAVTPAVGATGVPANQSVSVTFSEAVTYGALPVVRLLQNGTEVSGTYELSADGTMISFTPAAPLSDKTSYAFVVQGFTNMDATREAAPFSTTFFVGVPPSVQGDVNGDGAFTLEDVKTALRMAGGVQAVTAQAITATGNKVTAGKMTLEDAVFLARVKAGKASF